MQRVMILIVVPVVICMTGLAGLAQTDAQEDYRAGKAAYEAGRFADSRDFFAKASQTDTRNPEVFLWLGKAHYQLGELEASIKAWRRTLALAPEEPYAKRMLEILRGQTTEIETTIGLIEVMISQRLYDSALRQCDALRANRALNVKQRSEVMVLRAKAFLGKRQAKQAQVTVHELLAKYPAQAKRAVTDLLLGQAKIQMGGENLAEGLAIADDALYQVGKSYEDQARELASVTRAGSVARATEVAQKQAYADVQRRMRANEEQQDKLIEDLKKGGKMMEAEMAQAGRAAQSYAFNKANVVSNAGWVMQQIEVMTATQLADRQDKINAALRKAVGSYEKASKVPAGDKAGEALLRMATIYDRRLKDARAAMATWLEIVRQFSGTAVAEDASWRIANFYDRRGKYTEAIEAYSAFLRNYRRSPNAAGAQFAIAECHEHLGQWVDAMDSYSNYINNFAQGPMVQKARDQINWIKTYRL